MSQRMEFERALNARHAAIMEAHSDLALSRQLEGIRTAATSLAPTYPRPYKYMTSEPYVPRSRSATSAAALAAARRTAGLPRSTYYPMAMSRRENPYWHHRVPYHPRTYGYYSTLSKRGVMTYNDYPIRAAVISSSLDQGLPAFYQLPMYHPQGSAGLRPLALGM